MTLHFNFSYRSFQPRISRMRSLLGWFMVAPECKKARTGNPAWPLVTVFETIKLRPILRESVGGYLHLFCRDKLRHSQSIIVSMFAGIDAFFKCACFKLLAIDIARSANRFFRS